MFRKISTGVNPGGVVVEGDGMNKKKKNVKSGISAFVCFLTIYKHHSKVDFGVHNISCVISKKSMFRIQQRISVR